MMVTARGLARYYTRGQPISMLSETYTRIGEGALPVAIFLIAAVVFHVLLRQTRYGKYTYAIGANAQAARVSGIRVDRHLVLVYTVAGLLAGLGGVVTSARAASGQAGMGMSYELDAIAASVIGGTSLSGGIGRIRYRDRHHDPGRHHQRIYVHRVRRLYSGHRQGRRDRARRSWPIAIAIDGAKA